MAKAKLKLGGKTVEDHPVLTAVFQMVGTHGVALETILENFKKNGTIVDWPTYVADAMKDGANFGTVRARVIAAVGEVYGPVYLKGFEARWDNYFGDQKKK